MDHGSRTPVVVSRPPSTAAERALAAISGAMHAINRVLIWTGGLALVAAAVVLTEGVVVRYVFHLATDWQDELAVFLIIGATFIAAAAVQERRGHIAIEAFIGTAGTRYDRVRRPLVDVMSLVFAGYFAWKCFDRLTDAWLGGEKTDSSWGAPLFVPYGLMAIGLGLLCIQLVLQILSGLTGQGRPE